MDKKFQDFLEDLLNVMEEFKKELSEKIKQNNFNI